MAKLNWKSIEKAVRELAEENPEFVYDRGHNAFCKYNPDSTQPGCIFGQALIKIGHPVPETETGPIGGVLRAMGVKTTPEQRNWALFVQGNQDNKVPWAECVKEADRVTSV